MANQLHQFKHRDIVRAFRAAEAAGVPNPTVRIDCPDGKCITVSGGKADEASMKKEFVQQRASFAKGGSGHMIPKQAANPQKPGGTAHAVEGSAPGKRAAAGGPPTRGLSASMPAKAGRTAPSRKGR